MLRPIVRVSSFLSKEIREILRQPWLVVRVILGPFLILLLVGLGFSDHPRVFRAVFVVPADERQVASEIETYATSLGPQLKYAGQTTSEEEALAQLRRGQVDLAVVYPPLAYETILSGSQAVLRVYHNEIDPTQAVYVGQFASAYVSEMNRRILLELVSQAKEQAKTGMTDSQAAGTITATSAIGRQLARLGSIPADVLVAPMAEETKSVATSAPSFVVFYAPNVLALILQHIAVSIAALALLREKFYGAIELFRVAPVTTLEILLGKYGSYLLLVGFLAVVLTAAMIYLLGVPLLGQVAWLALSIGLLIFASLGIGFAISATSGTDSQAVQFSMLVLRLDGFGGLCSANVYLGSDRYPATCCRSPTTSRTCRT
jgi:ABC-2 type transport system permease protein